MCFGQLVSTTTVQPLWATSMVDFDDDVYGDLVSGGDDDEEDKDDDKDDDKEDDKGDAGDDDESSD